MKKFLALLLALVMMLSVVALVACGDDSDVVDPDEGNTDVTPDDEDDDVVDPDEDDDDVVVTPDPVVVTYTGEYTYTVAAWYTTYGCKVDVTLTDGVISAVKIYSDEETGYHNVSDENADYGWTEAAIKNWTDNQETFAASFVGMTAAEVLTIEASCDGSGASVEGIDVVTGATQSCARVILAIQNAICEGISTAVEFTGTAYGIVHSSYVGIATVSLQGNDVLSVVLDEMCTPLWLSTTTYATYFEVVADGEVAADYSEYTSNSKYFTTFYIGSDITFTYTTEDGANTYVLADGTTLLEWLAVEANCETYYTAVVAGEVSVETGDTDLVLTASMLQKSLNGYWGTAQGKTEDFWLEYAAATCAYVVANDFSALWMDRLDDNTWVDSNGATTSATWKDMYDYVNLIRAAAGVDEMVEAPEVADPVTEDGTYTSSAAGSFGNSFDVTVTLTEGVIASVVIEDTSVTGTAGYDTTFDAGSEALLASFVGMTPAEVIAALTTEGFVSGATDSSSALLTAVANALSEGVGTFTPAPATMELTGITLSETVGDLSATLSETVTTGSSDVWPENEGREMDIYTVTLTGTLSQSDFEAVEVTYVTVQFALTFTDDVETVSFNLTEYAASEIEGVAVNVARENGTWFMIKSDIGTSYVACLDADGTVLYECYLVIDFSGVTLAA